MDQTALLAALQIAMDAQQADEMDRLARTAVEQYPKEAWGYYYLGEANWLQGELDNTELCLAKAIELDEQNNDYRIRFAQLKEAAGEYEDMEILYGMILERSPQEGRALLGLARYYLDRLHDGGRAVQYLDKTIALDSNDPMLYCLRAQAYLLLEKPEQALADSRMATEKGAGEQALILEINALGTLQRFGDQALVYAKLLELAPNNGTYIWQYAEYLAAEQQWAAAEEQIRRLLTLEDVPFNLLWEALSDVLEQQGRLDEAIAAATEWINITPNEWAPLARRAHLYALSGNAAGALADLQTAATMVSAASRPRLQVEQARILLNMNDLKEAGKLFQQLSKTEGYEGEGFFGLGKVYHQAKQMDKAFESLRQAVSYRQAAAKDYLATHFAAQAAQHQTKRLEQYAGEIAKNTQVPSLQPIFAKVWRFDAAINPLPAGVPEDIGRELQKAVADTTILMSERGILIISPMDKKPLMAVYKTVATQGAQATIEVAPLDGMSPYTIQLEVNDKGHLLFVARGSKSAPVRLRAADPKAEGGVIRRYLNKTEAMFLGETMAGVWAGVFGE